MKRGAIWIVLTCLIVMSLVLASCKNTTTTTTSTSMTTSTSTSTTTKTTTSTTSVSSTTSSTTTSGTGNWWDSLGNPQYGGTTTLRVNQNIVQFDVYNVDTTFAIMSAWMERLFANDWTVDPSIFGYKIQFRSSDFVKGQLALGWEFPDPSTFVVHIRQGVHWQNIPPANGREFTASDAVYHYNRMFGFGGGFTKPSPNGAGNASMFFQLTSATAVDKYTAVFKWTVANPELILENMLSVSNNLHLLENSDAVNQWGNTNDWHHAIGTGPFILQDFVSGSSATLIKNPDYYGHDERYPQNQLPYIDKLNILIIPDTATALAGIRSGKIDVQDGVAIQDVQLMQKTNPQILVASFPSLNAVTLNPRDDSAPFKDIRVRKAMQMAIDLPTLAKTYYAGTADPQPSSLTSYFVTGWGFPYAQWPQDLKDEYAYNPTLAKQILADAGYPTGFNTNLVVDSAADLQLMQVVKSYFAAIGINMDIRPMDSASWASYVQVNHKNDGLAVRAAGNLGLTYEPLVQFQRLRTGVATDFMMLSDPVYDAFYDQALAANTIDGVKKALRDCNEYVARNHFVVSLLQYSNFALYQPWLKGYNGQLYGAGLTNPSGLPMLSFYQARFWIDQNVKKAMGH